MESSGLILPKFIKFLTNADTKSDYLELPYALDNQYGGRLQESFLLKFRNGYELPVDLSADDWTLYGLSKLYEDFGLNGGEFLVFEYNGINDFNVYVIGSDLTEIEYPNVVHYLQKNRPRVVSVRNGGLKFVTFVNEENPMSDECEPPSSFKRATPLIRGYQNFLFSNGKKIEGGYHHDTGRFHGLKKFCLILGIEDFRNYNLVLFTYEHDKTTKVSVYDDHFVEVMFPGSPVSTGLNSHNPTVFGRIEIHVKPFHMYKYCHGVDISTVHERITAGWRPRDYITAYLGDRSWKLAVRARKPNYQRKTILEGWIQFREDLGLAVGDLVILECPTNSRHHFSVQVIKQQLA